MASKLTSRLRRTSTDAGTGPGADAGTDAGEKTPRDRSAWRTRVAALLWTVCVLLALVLAVGALLVAVEAVNEDNALVRFVLDAADVVDLGVFSRDGGVLDFSGANAETKNALFNWGLGAVVYLVVGRLLERLVRPGR
ncbi:MAG TPA: hypothetical protein VGE43_10975 [Acidimicrobiales bacterium]